jgi:hypothetical protein
MVVIHFTEKIDCVWVHGILASNGKNQMWCVVALCLLLATGTLAGDGTVVTLTDANYDTVMNEHEIVLVNFYADWCRFSQVGEPTLAPPFFRAFFFNQQHPAPDGQADLRASSGAPY